MKKIKSTIGILALLALFFACTPKDHAGGVDSTETGISANLYQKDGTPAVGALVAAYDVHSTSGSPIETIYTDDSGRFNFPDSLLSNGEYNIIATLDTLGFLWDSVLLIQDSLEELKDTLKFLGQINGYVSVQSQHSPQIVTIHVSGSDVINVNVDVNGFFQLPEMVPGTYNVEFRTNGTYSGEYSPTYESITVMEGLRDTIADTIDMIFTGIPIVTGMSLIYDTTFGKVTISWDMSDYDTTYLQAYLIERKDSATASWPTDPVGISYVTSSAHDTTYDDYPFVDDSLSANLVLHYRVRIRDDMGEQGPPFNYVQITVPNPKSVAITPRMSVNSIDSAASINDTLTFIVQASNPTRDIDSLRWGAKGEIYSVAGSSSGTLIDTLEVSFPTAGTHIIHIALYDDQGFITYDSIFVTIKLDKPIIESVRDSITKSTDTISAIVTDLYGSITNYSWDLGNTGNFLSTDTTPKIFVSSSELFIHKPLVLQIMDDDSNIVLDTTLITYRPEWNQVTTAADFTKLSNVQVVGNTIIFIDSAGVPSVSSDGITWESTGQAVPFDVNNKWFTLVEFQGVIWALSVPDNDAATLWKSADLLNWTKIDSTRTLNLTDSDAPPLLFVFRNQLHTNITLDTLGELQATSDGTTWFSTASTLPTTIGTYGSLLTTDNNIYVFAQESSSNDLNRISYDRYMYPIDTTLIAPGVSYSDRRENRFHHFDTYTLGNAGTTLYYYEGTKASQIERLTDTPGLTVLGSKLLLFNKNFWYFDTDGSLWKNK